MAHHISLGSIPGNLLEKIHTASLKILTGTGVVFHSLAALELFQQHGAKVDGETVRIPEKMVAQALDTCPQTFEWTARNPDHSVILGEGFHVQPPVGAVFIRDSEKGRRLARLEDYANIIKLCQASAIIDLNGSIPVDASDVPVAHKHLAMMATILNHTDKPIIGMCLEAFKARQNLEMLTMALGCDGTMGEKHYAAVLVNPLSPLGYSKESVETIIEYTKQNQIILLAPCIMAGVSGPINLLGTSILQNTEVLAGIVLAQLSRPGAPVVYGTASSVGNMRSGSFAAGSPEAMLVNLPNIQLARDHYKLPTRTMCGITHAKEINCQAGYETTMSAIMGVLSGANIAVQCIGTLEALMTVSYEKMMIDQEIISRALRIQAGIEVSDEALVDEIIQQVGPGGSFLTHPSTFAGCRGLWAPSVSNWQSYEAWEASGSEDAVFSAKRQYNEILANAPATLLDEAVADDLRRYVATLT